MKLNDIDTISKLAGLTVKAEEIERDACAQFMDRWKQEKKESNQPVWTGE